MMKFWEISIIKTKTSDGIYFQRQTVKSSDISPCFFDYLSTEMYDLWQIKVNNIVIKHDVSEQITHNNVDVIGRKYNKIEHNKTKGSSGRA